MAIFGMATDYAESAIEPFVGSALESGYLGEIWLGITTAQHRPLMEFARLYRVRLVTIDGRARPLASRFPVFHFHQRWLFFRRWLDAFDDSDWILTSDVRDAYFQRDALAPGFQYELADINLFEEAEFMTVGKCPFNSQWIRDCWGEAGLARCANNRILCSGNVIGRVWALRLLIDEMLGVISSLSCTTGSDQGVLNYLNMLHRWHNGNNGTVRVWRQGTGPVNTVGYLSAVPTNSVGLVTNVDGSVSALVHQYDRHANLSRTYAEFAASRSTVVSSLRLDSVGRHGVGRVRDTVT